MNIRQRMSNHLSAIINWKDTSLANHFVTAGHTLTDHFKVGIIDQEINTLEEIHIREGVWIGLLNSVNNGLNERN